VRRVRRLDLVGGSPSEVSAQLDEVCLPGPAVLRDPASEGVVVFTDERDAAEVSGICADTCGLPVAAEATGTLVAVVTRPDTDVAAEYESLVPETQRGSRRVLTEPGAAMALIDPGDADHAVIELHRELVEHRSPADTPAS
jgi:hypothetical protein